MMDLDDVLGDTIALYGDERVEDDTIQYGPLVLSTAPKARSLASPCVAHCSSLVRAGRQGNAPSPSECLFAPALTNTHLPPLRFYCTLRTK